MILTWSVGQADTYMAESILSEHAASIRRHPWWRARARVTLAMLEELGILPPAAVLDVGCGSGVTLAALERKGYRAVGMDVSRRALEMLDREGSDRELIEADLTQALGPGIGRYDAVLALDVIEHLDDDRAAIERLAVLLKPGAVLVVSVPALPEMFSAFDAIQGHRRRYLPDVLRSVFAGTGLTIERVIWWGAWLVPLLRHQRRRPLRTTPGETVSQTYGRYLRLPWPARWILRVGFAWEQGRALSGKLTTGTSLFAIARCRA